MTDNPAWIDTAITATAETIVHTVVGYGTDSPGHEACVNGAKEDARKVLQAFFDHVPLESIDLQPASRHSRESRTLRLLKSTFTQP